ncbi:NGG1p interacting factor NIF3 [Candidatus Peregrinibacteria bacterium CG10_big_fil_rev_8_21_14_0_10_49_10]|nr:MAG: NGG1p interacting factor NIF3 [Candidatus Peregrinibacteria bacterium CG10_big_fil_rev_8_21_14_0_10_49_10]
MKLNQLFQEAITIGMEADVREKKDLEKLLKKYRDKQKKLEAKEKKFFDTERTWNPYSDSRILNGTGNEEVKRLAIGVDIETPELLLISALREKGEKVDAVFIHHPEGRGLADLDKVMGLQIDVLAQVGVPVNHSEAQLRPRMERIWRAIHADNILRTERAAELLGIPCFCCHTPTDNLVWRFMEKNICSKQFDSLGDILDTIIKIPEYEYYAKKGNPPIIVNGTKSSRPGKIVATEFTGGTNGPEEQLEEQSRAGVGTILSMHVTEKTLEKAKEHNVNMIQCSHMASDAIGMNLMLDKLSKKGKLDVLELSGFVRVKRK